MKIFGVMYTMMRFRKVIVMFCGIVLLTGFSPAQKQQLSPRENGKKWLKEAKFGVFVHYLGEGPNWNERVESFNADKFADQLQQTGAKYLIFTLGQNSGYYCSPNASYEKYAGYKTGQRCSKRDLPMEITEALAKRGIRLMLYLPSRSPQRDNQAMAGLHDVHERQPAPQEFTKRWSEVIAEWSLRYGTKISGWWFDGSYNTAGWDDLTRPYNWNTWAAACLAGNPESILAFNPGTRIDKAFTALTDQQDYTAGEQNKFQVTPETNPAQKDLQWHILSFLGTRWAGRDGPTNSDEYMVDYVRKVNALGGTVTIDVNVSADGTIYPPHLRQLIAIGKEIQQ
jgi:alpha-L-fucosidase